MRRVRVAAHVHSDWSYDGSWTLDALAAELGRRGYDAALMSEHDRGLDAARWQAYQAACAAASAGGALLIPGIEYSDADNIVHVPAWGDLPFLGEGLATGELLDQVDVHGGVAIFAHPARRDALNVIDPACLDRFTGIEVWNRKYDGYAPSRAAADLLRRHPGALATVGLDFHTRKQFHPLAMVMDLEGGATAAGIIDAIRGRRAQAMAFRMPALTLTRGAAWPAMREVERARKGAAQRVRRARRFAEAHRAAR
jgi:hypothetical protein